MLIHVHVGLSTDGTDWRDCRYKVCYWNFKFRNFNEFASLYMYILSEKDLRPCSLTDLPKIACFAKLIFHPIRSPLPCMNRSSRRSTGDRETSPTILQLRPLDHLLRIVLVSCLNCRTLKSAWRRELWGRARSSGLGLTLTWHRLKHAAFHLCHVHHAWIWLPFWTVPSKQRDQKLPEFPLKNFHLHHITMEPNINNIKALLYILLVHRRKSNLYLPRNGRQFYLYFITNTSALNKGNVFLLLFQHT